MTGIVQLVLAPLTVLASVFREATRVIPQLDLTVATGRASRPPLIDRLITSVTKHPYYSICIEAYKRRHLACGA